MWILRTSIDECSGWVEGKLWQCIFVSIILSDANEETPGSGKGTLWNNSLPLVFMASDLEYGKSETVNSGLFDVSILDSLVPVRTSHWHTPAVSSCERENLWAPGNSGRILSEISTSKSFSGVCDGPVALVSWKSEVSLQGVSATSLPTTLCSSKYLWFSRTTDTIYSPAKILSTNSTSKESFSAPALWQTCWAWVRPLVSRKSEVSNKGSPLKDPCRHGQYFFFFSSATSFPTTAIRDIQHLFTFQGGWSGQPTTKKNLSAVLLICGMDHTVEFDLLSYRCHITSSEALV